MSASIVGASAGGAPEACAAMSHPTARGVSSPSGRRRGQIAVAVDPPVSHGLASFAGKPNEAVVLRVSDTGLKIRVSLVQFRPWALYFRRLRRRHVRQRCWRLSHGYHSPAPTKRR
jgi:hypothetical protein